MFAYSYISGIYLGQVSAPISLWSKENEIIFYLFLGSLSFSVHTVYIRILTSVNLYKCGWEVLQIRVRGAKR